MARIGVFVGVGDEQNATYAAEKIRSATGFVGDVIRLRDRTGPSVAERVTALEAANADTVSRCGAMFREIGDRTVNMCDKRVTDVEKRLDALESALGEPVCVGCGGTVGQHHAPDGGGCSGWFPTVREHLARIETEHRAAVYRISDMERLPVASPPATTEPTPEQIEAYLRGSADWHQAPSEESRWKWRAGHFSVCVGDRDVRRILHNLAKLEGVTPAEMRARILGASSGAADPDRLVKVATDDDLLDLFERSEYASGDTRAARRALYDLGRAHVGVAKAAIAPTTHVPDGETLSAPQPAPKPTTGTPIWDLVIADMMQRDRLGRARYGTPLQAFNGRDALVDAYQESLDQCAYLRQAIEERKANAPPAERRAACVDAVPDGETRDPLTDPREGDWFVEKDEWVRHVHSTNGGICSTAMKADVNETICHSKDDWQELVGVYGLRPMTPAEVEAFKRDGTRPTATKPEPTEDEMAAELREAGWSEGSGWRSPRDTLFAWHRYTADAYAAMRAAKGAK